MKFSAEIEGVRRVWLCKSCLRKGYFWSTEEGIWCEHDDNPTEAEGILLVTWGLMVVKWKVLMGTKQAFSRVAVNVRELISSIYTVSKGYWLTSTHWRNFISALTMPTNTTHFPVTSLLFCYMRTYVSRYTHNHNTKSHYLHIYHPTIKISYSE